MLIKSCNLQGIGSKMYLSNLHLLVVLLRSEDFHHLFLYSKDIDALGESEFCRGQLAKAYQTAAVLYELLKAGNGDKAEEPPPEVKPSPMLCQCEFVNFSSHTAMMLQFCMLTFTGCFSSCIS